MDIGIFDSRTRYPCQYIPGYSIPNADGQKYPWTRYPRPFISRDVVSQGHSIPGEDNLSYFYARTKIIALYFIY
jgi:hypothetical protein